jgi:monoamine oxidase
MTRKEFLENSLLMGIGLPFLMSSFLKSTNSDQSISRSDVGFKGKVLIIGAGAAGMAAGYALKRYGVDFEILEAASVFGGRLKKAEDFTDFPIDLGAEWIHIEPKLLNEITRNHSPDTAFETMVYNPQTIQTWKNGKLRPRNYIRSLYSEWKFKDSTWFDFFEENIIPEISDRLKFNKPVSEIDYTSKKIKIVTVDKEIITADKVLVTIPVKLLQNKQITFRPELSEERTKAVNKIFMGDGIKIFVEFKQKFYPDILSFGNIFKALIDEEKFVYNAAFKKDSASHVLALFAINDKASAYTSLKNEGKIITRFLKELDEIFEGQATKYYVKHTIQNWSKEPFIQGAYSYAFEGRRKAIINTISKPIMNKVFFAGEALSLKHHATVHGACGSAYESVDRMLKN